jgi:hypothetical protein
MNHGDITLTDNSIDFNTIESYLTYSVYYRKLNSNSEGCNPSLIMPIFLPIFLVRQLY